MWLVWTTAAAQDLIDVRVQNKVEVGQEPSLTIRARAAGTVSGELRCGAVTVDLGATLEASDVHTVSIRGLEAGRHPCEGTLRLDAADGSWGSMPLGFEVALLRPIQWSADPSDVDVDAQTLTVRSDRPLTAATLQAVGLGGAVVASASADLTDPRRPRFRWTTAQEVLQLVVRGTDPDGFASELTLTPWSYAIPHEDVVFDTASHTVTAGEVPKLEACWRDVQAVLEKYGPVVDIELFVAGYTDTVGAAASNEVLSRRRARAIATWFRRRGFTRPIWFQGFGERVLAVSTPDETDQPANRRALYVLAATAPVSEQLPASAWQRLP
ncbi:MAG: OmpA family protein [Myxococcales bacterium]|nr:OmpA family protein [Myxococcales bacterium]